jgi:replicative DNA helicase
MYEFHDTINELEIREKSQKSIYIPTGFDKLDKLIKGIKPQDLIVIAGNPGTGNTAFLMSLIVNIINHSSTQIVYFSFDLTVQNLFIRLISTLTKINLTKLEDGLISENECDVIYNTLNPLPDNQLYFYEQTNYNYSELKFQIEKLIFQYKIKIVAIDYLQIISNGEVMTQESYMLITKELKLIAKELKISIILVSHINHIPVNEISKISDLQEISYLFEYSNVFLMLNQLNFNLNMFDDTDSNSTDYELIVAKNTNSKKGKVQMQMNNSYLQFTELDT